MCIHYTVNYNKIDFKTNVSKKILVDFQSNYSIFRNVKMDVNCCCNLRYTSLIVVVSQVNSYNFEK